MPVAMPVESTAATSVVVVSLAQVTCEVMSAVEPSEYFPVAVNALVVPTVKLAGEVGDTAIEDNVGVVIDVVVIVVVVVVNVCAGVDVFFDEQPAITMVNMIINPIARQ